MVLGSLARFLLMSLFLSEGECERDIEPRQKKTGDSVLLLGSDAPDVINSIHK